MPNGYMIKEEVITKELEQIIDRLAQNICDAVNEIAGNEPNILNLSKDEQVIWRQKAMTALGIEF